MSYFKEANAFLRMLKKGEMDRQKAQRHIDKILVIAARIELTAGMPGDDSPSDLAPELQDLYYDTLTAELEKANPDRSHAEHGSQRFPTGKVTRWLQCHKGHETFGPTTMQQVPCSICGEYLLSN
ncbi:MULTISPECIES: hypothetical protein [Acidithiobacillus]|jgi:hypothetical protein|uniref:Uncharacterized protein n=2 Tax=Acidithiobacillus thiooxidans TaxID=930 RepID=A0A1C2IVS7_ACITH|nr:MULTISPECIES: hypothetical protein [Acidithiobacillus]MDD2748971.1 hypothetical protein [Acidithiobacillus sp.]MDD5280212.1 hypothetical protein [Acidithiobacillus sp.]OCX72072.1 hypothetical protein A6M23_10475 [Acidithiobacillus thiooxidans]OCX80057.1 hypothetical protein A6P08_17035 [Acidithiobacillus thiooxidans]QFX95938.1 hypothetical protein GCD22_01635 [Acidithiobacillus thiooxidans ATCC 19377]